MVRPGMTDGRCFTSYISNCQLNDIIKKNNDIVNDSNYRMFLQQNGKTLSDTMFETCSSDENKLCNIPCKPFK
uniref:Uncharacterized protein n=1 Tax=viral metagenome TaxID=1070528 RepID=A0A6C0F5H0_9ZZZZ